MKKIKLLMPILGISAIATAAIPLASCNNKQKEEATYPFLFQALTNTTCSVKIKEGCKLETLTIPTEVSWFGDTFKVVAIAAGGFAYNEYIKNLIVPETVTTIGAYAFVGCTALETIEFKDTSKRWEVKDGETTIAEKSVNGKHASAFNFSDKYCTNEWRITDKARVPATKISFTSGTTQTLNGINDIKQLQATVEGGSGVDNQIMWSTSDASKVKVTPNGYIVSSGITDAGKEATITIFAADDESKSASCTVKVAPLDATSISLDFNQKKLSKDDALMVLHADLGKATNKVEWTSLTSTIATVDKDTGKVAPLAVGTAKFKASVTTSSETITKEVEIEIVEPSNTTLFNFEDLGTSYCIKGLTTKEQAQVKNLTFPAFYNGKPVSKFSSDLLNGWSKEPDGQIQTLDPQYERNRIESIIIPNSMTTIASGVFADCKNIKTLVLPNSTTEIEEYAFNGSRVQKSELSHNDITTDFYIPANIQKLGCGALAINTGQTEWGAGITNYHFVEGLWNIKDWSDNVVAVDFDAHAKPEDASKHAHWETTEKAPSGAHNKWVKI